MKMLSGLLALLLAVCLTVCGCANTRQISTAPGSTGTLLMTIRWPALPAPGAKRALPAATRCVEVLVTHQCGWNTKCAAARPVDAATSQVTVPNVPVGQVKVRFSAYDDAQTTSAGVAAHGNLLSWVEKDAVVEFGKAVSVSVTFPPVPTVALTADSTTLTPGASTTLRWSASDADRVVASSFGAVAVSGSLTIAPSVTTTYTLTVAGQGGQHSASVTVTVTAIPPPPAAPTVAITADSTGLVLGAGTTLRWSASNAAGVVSSNFGAAGVNGTLTITPASTTTYMLTVSGAGGQASAGVTVTVYPPPTLTLTATNTTITAGESTTLRWSSTNADTVVSSCFGAATVNGTLLVSPTSSTNYTLTVAGPGGQVTANVTVTVTVTPTNVNATDGAAMVWVPTGTFSMGSIYHVGYMTEQPAHQVTMSGYWFYKDDVTVAEYRAFCTATGHPLPHFPQPTVDNGYPTDFSWAGMSGWDAPTLQQHPIVFVTWDDAQAYAAWAGVQLPTEAQWEYAARGTQGNNFPWGGTAAVGDDTNGWDATKCANYDNSGNLNISTWPVGSFPADTSWCGARDMAGNVAQWCADWFDVYGFGPYTDPTGPATVPSSGYRIQKGGAWNYPAMNCRSAIRFNGNPASGDSTLGFRCVSHAPAPTNGSIAITALKIRK